MTVMVARIRKNRNMKRMYLPFFMSSPHPNYGFGDGRFIHPGLPQYIRKKDPRDSA
jgi:hypothetical protein